MSQTEKLADIVSRLTAEQYARLLAFAEALAGENSKPDTGKTEPQTIEMTETELLNLIQQKFPEERSQRLRELTQKSKAEVLSDEERAEYIVLDEELEAADAERMKAVMKLAQLRNLTPAQLMQELSISTNANG